MISINLTTIPSRLPYIRPCLVTLNDQRRQANEINLWLPMGWNRFSEEPGDMIDSIKIARRYCNVFQVPYDHGPITKLLAPLYNSNADQIIIVDDDVAYPDTLTIDLQPDLDRAHGYRGKTLDAASYKNSHCNYAEIEQNCNILTGTWGIGMHRDWFDVKELKRYVERAQQVSNLCDDIVINAYLKDKGIERHVVATNNRPQPLDYAKKDALWGINKDSVANDTLIQQFGLR